MPARTLESRVDSLERRVDTLEQLPARMTALESQIVQLRAEMRDEFSAIRHEMRSGDQETRRVLREELRAGDEETRTLMRVLHEDVINRIALIGDARGPRRSADAVGVSPVAERGHHRHFRSLRRRVPTAELGTARRRR